MIVKTRKGVVLATGGYAHNKALREKFMPQPTPVHSLSFAGNQGDGVAHRRKSSAPRCRAGTLHQRAVDAGSLTTRPTAARGFIRISRSTAPSPA